MSRRTRRLWRWWVAGAAAALLVVAVGYGIVRQRTYQNRLQTVSLLAINNHLNDQHINIHTDDRKRLESGLTKDLPFAAVVPRLDEDLQLLGGRTCALGTHPVAYSLWQGPRGKYSLFQFRPDDFGLPSQVRPNLVRADEPAGAAHPCGALFWADGRFGYVLVGDAGNTLERLFSPP